MFMYFESVFIPLIYFNSNNELFNLLNYHSIENNTAVLINCVFVTVLFVLYKIR